MECITVNDLSQLIDDFLSIEIYLWLAIAFFSGIAGYALAPCEVIVSCQKTDFSRSAVDTTTNDPNTSNCA